MLKKFLKNKKISWKHTNSSLKSSKIVNLKVDILSSFEVEERIDTKSKYIHFLLRNTLYGKLSKGISYIINQKTIKFF